MINKLKERRKALRLRMVDVAMRSGVGVSTIWLAENGYSKRILPNTRRKISEALGSSVRELFEICDSEEEGHY